MYEGFQGSQQDVGMLMPEGRGFLCCCGFIKSQALKCCVSVSNPLLALPGWEVTQNSRPTPCYPKWDALGSRVCSRNAQHRVEIPGKRSGGWRAGRRKGGH